MSIDKTLAELDRLIAEVSDRVYDCECGKRHILRPNSSMIARVECPCGARCDFNLDPPGRR